VQRRWRAANHRRGLVRWGGNGLEVVLLHGVRLTVTTHRQIAATIVNVPTSVLIVDDHPSFRSSAHMLLEAEGFKVVGEAPDGETALESVYELSPDLVLLDVQLPGIDGFEVTRRLRANGNAPAVILVSSRDCGDYGSLAEESGALGFVAKAELSGAALEALLP